MRTEAANYDFFIRKGFITNFEEFNNLYKWFNKNGCVKDQNGKIRVRILKRLSKSEALEVIRNTKHEFEPGYLRSYIAELLQNNQSREDV
jgi:hypothetical protein